MKPSTPSKDNTTSGKKATKQTTILSSSLKSIMKYGGKSAAEKDRVSEPYGVTFGSDILANNVQQTDGIFKKMIETNESDIEPDKEARTCESGTKGAGYKANAKDSERGSEKRKWDESSAEGKASQSISMDTMKFWETEIMNLEKDMQTATTKDTRKVIEEKIHKAQYKLKQAILSSTNGGGYNTDDHKRMEGNGSIETIDLTDDNEDCEMKEEGTEGGTIDVEMSSTEDKQLYDNRVESSFKGGDAPTTNWDKTANDETALLQNQKGTIAELQWQTVANKTQRKNTKEVITKQFIEQDTDKKKGTPITKVFGTSAKGNINKSQKSMNTRADLGQPSLVSYMEKTREAFRSKNMTSICANISFYLRSTGTEEYARIAREVLSFGQSFDSKILLLPWKESAEYGPINSDDLVNPKNYSAIIKKYFDIPSYINWQPGTTVYGIGIHISTNLGKYEFFNRWNLHKQELKQNNCTTLSISMASMQHSPTAFIIGIGVGSTEKQDIELLNNKLTEETGIEGIEVSFQNVNQSGITPEFWKLSNEKALEVTSDRNSRNYLREKYRWAPNTLAIYVPPWEMVSKARKVMLTKYGKTVDGNDPVWPDGSSMRFLPIKGATIKNEKTRNIVRKRLAYHIWLKATEVNIDTNMVNIHKTIEPFGGLTFSEIVLKTQNSSHQRVFLHFNRVWTNDPGKEKWSLSVKGHLQESATRIVTNLRDELFDIYGHKIDMFFNDKISTTSWKDATSSKPQNQEDDDDWFDDDEDIDELVKKGYIDSTFLKFFEVKEDEEDKQSVASWGTGLTTCTEIVANKESIGTVSSSISQDTPATSQEELDKKKDIV